MLLSRSNRVALALLLALSPLAAAVGEIIVTARDRDLRSTTSSIDAIGAEDVAPLGQVSIADLLNNLPNSAQDQGTGVPGTANVDLRGLGADRTLVLLNGRRLVTGQFGGYGIEQSVDLNTIPTSAIERIEIVKDGAGAIYGARAMNGVINVITRENPQLTTTAQNYSPVEIINPVTPALSVYDTYVRGATGSVEYNQMCDYGNSTVTPGTFLAPWTYGYNYEQDGFNFMIPFAQVVPEIPSGDANTPDAPADNAAPENPPQANNNGNANASPPPPKTGLQRWDRGVPPWSLVLRSPEVAHLLEELKPYYDLRFDTHAEMSALGYWGLSDYELAENRPAYDIAREKWKGTRREILTLLGEFMDPAIAATATTGDPSWDDGPGAPLSATVFAGKEVVHPSQRAPATSAGTGAANTAPGDAPADAGAATADTPSLSVNIKGIHGSIGGTEYSLNGNPGRIVPELMFSMQRYKLDIHTFLAELQAAQDGSVESVPATGAGFKYNYPFERKVALPLEEIYKDPEFNSDLCADTAFGGADGSLQYGDLSTDIDGYLQGNGRSLDYDARWEARLELSRRYYDKDIGDWNYSLLQEELGYRQQATPQNWGYVPTDYRLGYNLETGRASVTVPVERYEGETFRVPRGTKLQFPRVDSGPGWSTYYAGEWDGGVVDYHNFLWPEGQRPAGDPSDFFSADVTRENDFCAAEAFPVNATISSVVNGRRIDDEWFMERIGVGDSKAEPGAPVVVAVIDTGLDYHHYDIDWSNIWRNPDEIPDNGIDDDNNGFVDDMIGWDFTAKTNTPWDHDGHGTFVTGLIAADGNNISGIAGVNPAAQIMVLKALNNFGHTRASWLAQAIIYAADNGARIINLSAAGPGLPMFVQDAIDYADSKGVLVFVAAGNSAENVDSIGPAGLDKVITVAATDLNDARAPFSNWGKRIDLAAPGMHIMSLRARQTDFRLTSIDTPYKRGTAILGADRRYYRADGTSFAAPLAAGAASLLWSQNPALTPAQVRRMLEQSARDIDTPGRDQYTGYGLLDAAAALTADPDYYTLAAIDNVAIAMVDGKQVARVTGTSMADRFAGAVLEVGAGEQPGEWKRIGKKISQPVENGVLGDISPAELQGSSVWTVRVVTEHKNKTRREARYRLNIG